MLIRQLHSWDLTVEEAIALQKALAKTLSKAPRPPRTIRLVAGADISYDKRSDRIWAAVAVFSLPAMELADVSLYTCRVHFPYIPGLLSFRETPPILDGLEALETPPDALLLDAHGLAHPRRFGLACHIGLLTSLPTVGCAKSLLVGAHVRLARSKGSQAPLIYKGSKVGVALRTRDAVRPVYVSRGYMVTLARAVSLVLDCTGSFRVPTPLRAAHALANRARLLRTTATNKVLDGTRW